MPEAGIRSYGIQVFWVPAYNFIFFYIMAAALNDTMISIRFSLLDSVR